MRFILHKNRGDLFHISFEIALVLKVVDGLLEIIGGVLLMFMKLSYLSHIAVMLTQGELYKDPNDIIANAILNFSQGFSISTQHFGILYLISHGIVKLILGVLLWQKKLWSYPLAIILLTLFTIYQMYRYTVSHSFLMILLTIIDLIIIILTFFEYKRAKDIINRKTN